MLTQLNVRLAICVSRLSFRVRRDDDDFVDLRFVHACKTPGRVSHDYDYTS